jgi:hypothetical protein
MGGTKHQILILFTLFFYVSLNAITVINEPSTVVRTTPEPLGLIDDILPYGHLVEILDIEGDWLKVRHADGEGWIIRKHLLHIGKKPNTNAIVYPTSAYVYHVEDTQYGPLLQLPFESQVEVIEELSGNNGRWVKVKLQDGKIGFVQRARLVKKPLKLLSLEEAIAFSQNFLGLDYLWGGTTSFGYDCSGFVQMIYRQMGVTLSRNSKDQFQDPRFVDIEDKDARPGDLAFFFNQDRRVVHVAMMVNPFEFIHATPKGPACITFGSLTDIRWRNGYHYYGLKLKRLKK